MIFLKFLILLIYIALLIALYRFSDFLAWSDSAGVAKLVDPLDLSLRELRWLLHARGINYYGAIEKKDLSDLVATSGPVTNDEVKIAENLNNFDSYDTVTFSTKKELQTSMDDSDDIWLVQIIAEHQDAVMKNVEWLKLAKHAHMTGIRTGKVYCKQTPLICREFSSQLILSNHNKKSYNGIHRKHYLTRKTDFSTAFNWVSQSLKDATEEIASLDDLKLSWLSDHSRKLHATQLIYVSELGRVPVFFAALQSKFRENIRFGRLLLKNNTQSSTLRKILRVKKNLPKSFVCLIVNQEIFIHASEGNAKSFLHFQSLHLFLLTFDLNVNHMFTWSVCICNVLAVLSFVTTSGNLFSRFVSVMKSLVFYNAVLLCAWVTLSGYQPSLSRLVWLHVQHFITTQYADPVRQCLQLALLSPHRIIIGFLFFFCALFSLLKRCRIVSADEYHDTLSELLLLNESRTFGYNDISRRWVERLATPGLWLQPLVSTDYIENLPVWKYTGECIETSDESDTNVGTNARTSSPSPSRKWTPCGETRGRSCFVTRPMDSSRSIKQKIMWSIRSCLRGRSPRFRRTTGPPPGMRVDHSCPICLDNYRSVSLVCGLPCGHVFHHDCILQWLHADHHCCPNCRWPAYQARGHDTR